MPTQDYNSLLEGFGATTEPLDTQGDYKQLLEGFGTEAPSVSQETVEEVTKQPVGRPQGVQEAPTEAPTGAPEDPAAAAYEAMYKQTDGMFDVMQSEVAARAGQTTLAKEVANSTVSPEYAARYEQAKEFAKEEAFPIVGGLVGTALMPFTGGTSLPMSLALTAGSAGVGAAVGEGVEQTLKYNDLMPMGATETRPRDSWDILGRSSWRGVNEAFYTFLPDLLVRGAGQGIRRLLMKGAKPAEDLAGNTLDLGRQSLQDVMTDYAEKQGVDVSKVLLTSDVVESGLFNAAENVAANSYISGRIPKVRAAQEEALKEAITEQAELYMKPAEGYVKSTSDEALQRFIEPNMEGMNDFAVAGLINVGFKKAQEAQKAVARATYKTIGNLMERTEMVSVYKEVELPFLDPRTGRPATTMQTVLQEQPAFPVDLTKLREIGEDRMDVLSRTGAKPDSQTAELMNMPHQTDYEAAAERLIDMKADSRSLGRSTAEGAAKQKLVLDKAIAEMEGAMESAMKLADESGIVTPDGRSLYELKKSADDIWKEQVEDFQNSYIMNIIKKTNPKNGAPEKLGRLFIQNETAAKNIIKVLEDAKGTLKGAELEQIVQAENAIKGSIVEEIFMPFDSATGKFVSPDMSPLTAKEGELSRIFGKEAFTELKKLGAALEQQAGTNTSNYLGFAQRARESGMLMTTMKGLSRADLGPLIKDGGATIFFALGAGRLLTSPKMIRQARMLADPQVDMATKTQIAQWLVHRTYEYQQAIEATTTDEERERMEAGQEDRKEAQRMYQGQ